MTREKKMLTVTMIKIRTGYGENDKTVIMKQIAKQNMTETLINLRTGYMRKK